MILDMLVWVFTLSGALATFGLSSYQGYTWYRRTSGGLLSFLATLACGFLIGIAAVLGAEAFSSYEYFIASWAIEGINARQIVFGAIVGSGPAVAGWLARRGEENRKRAAD